MYSVVLITKIDKRFTGPMDSFVYHGEVSVVLGNSARGEKLVKLPFRAHKSGSWWYICTANGLLLVARATHICDFSRRIAP